MWYEQGVSGMYDLDLDRWGGGGGGYEQDQHKRLLVLKPDLLERDDLAVDVADPLVHRGVRA